MAASRRDRIRSRRRLGDLFAGLLFWAIAFTPDTGHGEDHAGVAAVALFGPVFVLSTFLGLGSGLGGMALLEGRARILPLGAIGLTMLGLACAVAFYVRYFG